MLKKLLGGTVLAAGALFGFGLQTADAEVRLHGFGGISMPEDSDVDLGYGYDLTMEFDNGFVVGGSVGVDLGSWVLEGEYSHRSADVGALSAFGYTVSVDDFQVSTDSLLANAWYQFGLGGKLEGYVGGGVGLGKAEFEGGGYTAESDSEMVWQLGAGIGLNLDTGITIGVGYRYFQLPELEDLDIDISSNDIIFEISKSF
jgi:OOP family OmpA-OmpF porin